MRPLSFTFLFRLFGLSWPSSFVAEIPLGSFFDLSGKEEEPEIFFNVQLTEYLNIDSFLKPT